MMNLKGGFARGHFSLDLFMNKCLFYKVSKISLKSYAEGHPNSMIINAHLVNIMSW